MPSQFSRTEMLIGAEGVEKLRNSKVIVFGVGGVGSYTVEALARAGVGSIDIVDNDTVSITNINRQLIALHSTVGMLKTDVCKSRILDINPNANVTAHSVFYAAENADIFDLSFYDYVIDAIDTVASKLLLIEKCYKTKTPIISSMGTGNKLSPEGFIITDIYKTSGCPLARVMRRELKKRGIPKLNVVFSPEDPKKPQLPCDEEITKRSVPASISFVPPVAGLVIAGHVINDLIR